ncbi:MULTISPECIES: prohibitin family protein [Halorussus]|uniref:prohibitin family protein n=1 Tax=Halorussus TaxID=1070314 RepID=UPI00209E29C5|nr:prohibitin family protein [Halorussus vallis]USZ76505.1 prohibitin family protein [Halorussus vallis]
MSSDPPIDTGGLAQSATVIGLVLLLLVSLVGGMMAFEGVNEGKVKVVKNQGAVTGDVLEPGWHFITPIIEGTVSVPTRPQTYTMSHQSGEGDNANQDDSVRVLTQDGLHVDVDVTVRYRVTPRDAPRFHEEYRDLPTAESRLIRPTVRSVLRTEGGNIDVTDIYTGEGQTRLKLAVEGALKNETEGSGIVIESVQIRNVRLPSEYAKSIEQKKVKQQKIEEAEYEIQVAKKNKERRVIEAEAEAEQIRIKGEALRRNPEVLDLRYIEALRENENTIYVPAEGGVTLTRDVTDDATPTNRNASSGNESEN